MLRTVLLCLLVSSSAPALAVYKCKSGDSFTYSDQPCAGGKVLDIHSANPDDSAKAVQQSAEDQKKLKRLENERRKLEAREEKERQRAAHADTTRHKRCASLERRKQWAEEDVADASGKTAAKAKQKARRIAEQFDDECGKPASSGLSAGAGS